MLKTILIVACLAWTWPASAATIGFDDLLSSGTTNRSIGISYESDGFRFQVPDAAGSNLNSPESGNSFFAGSAALAPVYAQIAVVTVTRMDGSEFLLSSLDLSQLNPDVLASNATVTVTGYREGLAPVQTVLTLPNTFGFASFTIPDSFSGLSSFTLEGTSGYQIDNVVAAIPEPGSAALCLLTGGLILIHRKSA